MMGRRLCAWCGTLMGLKMGLQGDTHGICPACRVVVSAPLMEKRIGR